MRKLKLQIQMSLDGYIAGPNGEMDWMVSNWDDQLNDYVGRITDPVDCIILGRKLAEGFIPYWTDVANDPANPEMEAGKKFTQTHKVVFTKTLDQSLWNNTVLAKGDLVEEINNLKNQDGGDIITYGGADFVSSLIRNRLINDFHFFVNPTLLGEGLPIFNELNRMQDLTLVKSSSFDCGIVVLNYLSRNT